MSFVNGIKNICYKLGSNNKPTYVVMAIAAVKGIARPTFTMMDKKEKPETKKYTALREGLTEVIAIPAYWACGELSAWGANILFKEKVGDKINPALIKAKKNLMFMGVCTAALFIIPAACSVLIKPIMSKMGLKAPKTEEDNNPKLDISTNPPQKSPTVQNPIDYAHINSYALYMKRPQNGMKVGGV